MLDDNKCGDISMFDFIKIMGIVLMTVFGSMAIVGGVAFLIHRAIHNEIESPKQEINHNNYAERKNND